MKNKGKGAAIAKIVIWSVVAVILVSLLALWLLLDGVIEGTFGIFGIAGSFYDDDSYTVGNTEYADNVKSIDVDWDQGSVSFKIWDGEGVRLEESGHSDKEKNMMRSRVEGGTLEIKFAASGLRLFSGVGDKQLVIFLSREIAGSLDSIEIDSASARVVTGNEADTQASFVCKSFSLESASGNAEIYGLSAESVSIECASGRFRFDGRAGSIELECVSGDVLLSGELGAVEIETVSSEIKLEPDRVPRRIDIETVSGSVVLTLPESEDGFRADLDSISGDMRYNSEDRGKSVRVGDGRAVFDFDTVSGDVDIYVGED